MGALDEGTEGSVLEVECRERVYRASSAGASLAEAIGQVVWPPSSWKQGPIRISMASPAPKQAATAPVQEFDPATSQMQPVAAPAAPDLSLVKTYVGVYGFAALIKDFANGAHAFGVEDFRDSYSPAQWTQLRPKLDAAGFRGARVFLKVDLSDEMKRYLGASTARAEVPSEILE